MSRAEPLVEPTEPLRLSSRSVREVRSVSECGSHAIYWRRKKTTALSSLLACCSQESQPPRLRLPPRVRTGRYVFIQRHVQKSRGFISGYWPTSLGRCGQTRAVRSLCAVRVAVHRELVQLVVDEEMNLVYVLVFISHRVQPQSSTITRAVKI